jgi:divalent metal cation (Fe/Co/Zn/Cd) transporter
LEYVTIVWSSFEGLVALIAGFLAGSISLVGFGIDSVIEVVSGSVLLWRMCVDADERRRERIELMALRMVGACFLTLSGYMAYEAVRDLIGREAPAPSLAGIVLACVSLVVMPFCHVRSDESATPSAVPRCTRTPNRPSSALICRPFC